jgi:coenzyme PQQ precursor peptide PqqA
MQREGRVSQTRQREWETPAFEEVRVSAEATAYMGIWDSDWT